MLILYAEDSPRDRELAGLAIKEAGLDCQLRCVEDGQKLLDYLHGNRKHAETKADLPDLILLDLNMPRKDGLEVLAEIKSDPNLWRIPVVVRTSSTAEADIFSAYDAGATSYVLKPANFAEFVAAMKGFGKWWLETVKLPAGQVNARRV